MRGASAHCTKMSMEHLRWPGKESFGAPFSCQIDPKSPLKPFWASWERLGASWGAPGSLLGPPRKILAHFETPQAFFGRLVGRLWVVFESSRECFLVAFARRSVKTQLQARISTVFVALVRSLRASIFRLFVLLCAIIFASLQSFFLHEIVVAQQASGSCLTSILLRMASVL